MSKNNQHIDQHIKDRFRDWHPEPPAHSWAELESRLVRNDRKRRFLKTAGVLLPIGILATALWFLLGSPTPSSETTTMAEKSKNIQKPVDVAFADTANMSQSSNYAKSAVGDLHSENGHEEDSKAKTPENVSIRQQTYQSLGVDSKKEVTVDFPEHDQSRMPNLPALGVPFEIQSNAIGLTDQQRDYATLPRSENAQPKYSYYEIIAGLDVEAIFQPREGISTQQSIGFSLHPRWYVNPHVYIESGLGLFYTQSPVSYQIDYLNYEYIDSYDDVYAMTFDTDETGNIVPIYHTREVEIWDSIERIQIKSYKDQFGYLRIPFRIGYMNAKGKLNWYVSAGPDVSIQVFRNLSDPLKQNPELEILDIRRTSPSIRSTIWGLSSQVGIGYQFSPSSRVVFEPSYRLYVSPWYDQSRSNISSFAFKIGVLIQL